MALDIFMCPQFQVVTDSTIVRPWRAYKILLACSVNEHLDYAIIL